MKAEQVAAIKRLNWKQLGSSGSVEVALSSVSPEWVEYCFLGP